MTLTNPYGERLTQLMLKMMDDKAEHKLESDGFDMGVCETAVNNVEQEGFDEMSWFVSPGTLRDAKTWYSERCSIELSMFPGHPSIAGRRVIMHSQKSDKMYLVAHDAVAESPVPTYAAPMIVRYPEGIAIVEL